MIGDRFGTWRRDLAHGRLDVAAQGERLEVTNVPQCLGASIRAEPRATWR